MSKPPSPPDPEPLCEADVEVESLVELVDAIGDEAQRLREQVKKCRDAGATWEQIGQALGTSRQAAQERFGKRKQSQSPDEANFARRIVRLRASVANKRAIAQGMLDRAQQIEDQANHEEEVMGLKVHSESHVERIK